MLYLLAILLPPVAVLLIGRPIQAVLNLLLTLLFYIPGVVHAVLLVQHHYEEKRTNRVIEALKQGQQPPR